MLFSACGSRAIVNEFIIRNVSKCARARVERDFSRSFFSERFFMSFFLWFQFPIFHVVDGRLSNCSVSMKADYLLRPFLLLLIITHHLSLLLIKFKILTIFWKHLISFYSSVQLTRAAPRWTFTSTKSFPFLFHTLNDLWKLSNGLDREADFERSGSFEFPGTRFLNNFKEILNSFKGFLTIYLSFEQFRIIIKHFEQFFYNLTKCFYIFWKFCRNLKSFWTIWNSFEETFKKV